MKRSTVLAGLGLLLVAAAPGARAETDTPALAVERIQFATTCEQVAPDPRCVSNEFELSLNPGAATVGNLLSITPAGYVLWADGGYTLDAYTADETLRPEYVLEGGSVITGQVTVQNTPRGTPTAAADSGVFVEILGSVAEPKPTGGTRLVSKTLGSAEIVKTVVAPGDHVYEFSFEVPGALDGLAVQKLNANLGQRHIGVGYGFINGQGGSYFDLPYVAPVEEPAPTE